MNEGQLKQLTDRLDALKESEIAMKDEMYTNLRNYAEEHSSLLRQLLEAQNKTNELLQAAAADKKAGDVPIGVMLGKSIGIQALGDAPATTKAAPKKGKPGVDPKAGWNS